MAELFEHRPTGGRQYFAFQSCDIQNQQVLRLAVERERVQDVVKRFRVHRKLCCLPQVRECGEQALAAQQAVCPCVVEHLHGALARLGR
nr:hypothetical protein [Lacisediminimonas profundi]